jgi:GT2 family glycosyltransferase
MAIMGHIDGMEGAYAVGWAAGGPESGSCAIELIDERGKVVAKGRASRHRPDLASLGYGRTTFAFRIPVAVTGARRVLRVLADGEELIGSPLVVGPGRFDGSCVIDGGNIVGWVTERSADAPAPEITVVNQHGRVVGRAASLHDESGLDRLFMPARFTVALEDQCFGAGEMALSVRANDVVFGKLACDLKLRGNLEIITPQLCQGWLISPEAPERNFRLELYRDGALAGHGACTMAREDVRAVFPGCSTPGFRVELREPPPRPLDVTTISLRLVGGNADLFDGPYVIGARPAAVAALYRAARIAIQDVLDLSDSERAVLQVALSGYLEDARKSEGFIASRQPARQEVADRPRLVIVIPIYRGVEMTRACINSVLAVRDAARDQIVLINDGSPEPEMAGMLLPFGDMPNVFLLTNASNRGFVQSVNRGLSFAMGADVLLLNADTVMYPGALDELLAVAYAQPEIGTVTALSNNATIFSYPHPELSCDALTDISWVELAAAALRENRGLAVDVPTGHGFCMLIKGEVLRRAGLLDEAFGRGYGEENDFCARTAALGYRNVAAAGVLVAHKESVSFEGEKETLLARNLPRLNRLYPEYTPVIMEFERVEGLRRARWGLDRLRLGRKLAGGARFVLLLCNALEGGTAKAMADIERQIGYGGALPLVLRGGADGMLELTAETPNVQAFFNVNEVDDLLTLLDAAAPGHVFVHQFLGFTADFISAFGRWMAGRHSVFYAHDFYSFCPRVTMIDAIGRFCAVAAAEVCARCVGMGGAHETSRLTELSPAEHREIFGGLLRGMTRVVAPSASAAGYFGKAFPGLGVEVLGHPEAADAPAGPRASGSREVILLGAIGPHKGSAKLLELAQRAWLTHPDLSFRVIGYTNMDDALLAVGNVTITGAYEPDELPRLLAQTDGWLALFLSPWAETYSYTLSEAVRAGLVPLVPDLGAPAERVRAAGYGVVFPAGADAAGLLDLIEGLAAGRVAAMAPGAMPAAFFPGPEVFARAAEVMGLFDGAEDEVHRAKIA